ncbi:ankyrin repeat domain-containing protein [Spirochaeta isovalerica]|uniref:Ankyrin repeat-containing protein n=1 Tax=Spirochaeta isovalerica TaxID=150 RepID=A0A841R671_9SPIO|nr:ankyrin repeat domain-containing protein [Spirochaeta isovalerica]MBB6478881.1 hypothetical protein [Spirochaeta isovalerica]
MTMIKFEAKLLIIIYFFFLFPLLLWGNRVSGLYDPPVRSVRFGRGNPFSFIPIGWSENGASAFMVQDNVSSTVILMIFDGIEDRVLFESEPFDMPEGGIGVLWKENRESFSQKLGDYSIIPDRNPSYGPGDFSWGNDEYSIYEETTMLAGNRGIASLNLIIKSEKKGVKSLYSYTHNDTKGSVLLDSYVVGYYLSPQERRILAISLDDRGGEGEDHKLSLRFNGAHLTIGFARVRTERTGLIEAVLSGQYYTTRALLEEGADPDIAVEGEPLLLMAARQNNWDIVFLLLQGGAEPAVVDGKGRMLLHYAALSGNRENVIRLVAMGMNKSYRDLEGRTAADLAEIYNNDFLIPLLKE